MDRRLFLAALGAGCAGVAFPGTGVAQTDAFETQLQALANDLTAIDAANSERERFRRVPGDPLGAQALSWTRASSSPISDRARQLIIACEISSRAAYDHRYHNPVWPGGASGVTIGIGYDLGQTSADDFRARWRGLLPDTSLDALATVCGIKGASAEAARASVRTIDVPWAQAQTQFDQFLPYAVGKTEDTFRNAVELPPACRGALVSLVYNRGPSLSHSDTRNEMREIARLMRERSFAGVPQQIRFMKRLWVDKPKMRGLLARRELEALLFEQGLAGQP